MNTNHHMMDMDKTDTTGIKRAQTNKHIHKAKSKNYRRQIYE